MRRPKFVPLLFGFNDEANTELQHAVNTAAVSDVPGACRKLAMPNLVALCLKSENNLFLYSKTF